MGSLNLSLKDRTLPTAEQVRRIRNGHPASLESWHETCSLQLRSFVCLERHVKSFQSQPGGLGAASLLAAAGVNLTRVALLFNGYAATIAELLSRCSAVAADGVGGIGLFPGCPVPITRLTGAGSEWIEAGRP